MFTPTPHSKQQPRFVTCCKYHEISPPSLGVFPGFTMFPPRQRGEAPGHQLARAAHHPCAQRPGPHAADVHGPADQSPRLQRGSTHLGYQHGANQPCSSLVVEKVYRHRYISDISIFIHPRGSSTTHGYPGAFFWFLRRSPPGWWRPTLSWWAAGRWRSWRK